MKGKQDEKLSKLIEALRPRLRELVEEILEEKLRRDPHALDGIETAGKDRPSFLKRSIEK